MEMIKGKTKQEYMREYNRIYRTWIDRFQPSWLQLQLGNKCLWCDRTSQEIDLQVDHVLPQLMLSHRENGKTNRDLRVRHKKGDDLIYEFLHGEELRLLCTDCHKIRHTI